MTNHKYLLAQLSPEASSDVKRCAKKQNCGGMFSKFLEVENFFKKSFDVIAYQK